MKACFLPLLYDALALDYVYVAWTSVVNSLSRSAMGDKVMAQRLTLAISVLHERLESLIRVLGSEE